MIAELCLIASRVNRKVLQDSHDHDRSYFVLVGAMLLIVTLFSFISFSYAMLFVFNSLPIALIAGGAWAAFIYVTDANIIMAGSKMMAAWRQIFMLIVRLGIGSIVAIVVATPVKLYIFEEQIDNSLYQEWDFRIQGFEQNWITKADLQGQEYEKGIGSLKKEFTTQEKLIESDFATRLNAPNRRLQNIQEELAQAKQLMLDAEEQYIAEMDGSGGSGTRGCEAICKAKYKIFKQKQNEYNILVKYHTSEISQLQAEIEAVEAEKSQAISKISSILEKNLTTLKGEYQQDSYDLEQQKESSLEQVTLHERLDSRLVALYGLLDDNHAVSIIFWGITLIFLIIELSPILFKALGEVKAYDILLEIEKEQKIKYGQGNIEKRSKVETAEILHQRQNEHTTQQKIHQWISQKLQEIFEHIQKYGIETHPQDDEMITSIKRYIAKVMKNWGHNTSIPKPDLRSPSINHKQNNVAQVLSIHLPYLIMGVVAIVLIITIFPAFPGLELIISYLTSYFIYSLGIKVIVAHI